MESLLRTPSQVGQLLKEGRRHRKLTQKELALKVGLSQSSLSKMEQGAAAMTLKQFLSLCTLLGLEVVVRAKADSAPSETKGPLPVTEW